MLHSRINMLGHSIMNFSYLNCVSIYNRESIVQTLIVQMFDFLNTKLTAQLEYSVKRVSSS